MKQIRINRQHRPAREWLEPLPPDARDPDVVRAKQRLLHSGRPGAHEEGRVEGEIGRFCRRHLVPVPAVTSVAALSDYKFYLFFTLTVHFGDALIVYLPRHP